MKAPATRKRFADCMAERADIWRGGEYEAPVERAVAAIVRALRDGGRVFFFGNGGSAAQAQHLAAELTGRFALERRSFAGIALSVDTSALTAIANDYGFERVFARQLEGLARPGDLAVGITTSGKSANVIEGLKAARERGCITVALSGNGGGPVVQYADIAIIGPNGPSWKVQEVQFVLGHIICELAELELAAP